MINWDKIRLEYITTNISYRELAEKHGLCVSNLSRHAKREDWPGKRLQNREKRERKAIEAIAERNADNLAELADILGDVNRLLREVVAECREKSVTIYDIKAMYDCISRAVDLERNIKKLPTLSEDLARLRYELEKERADIGKTDGRFEIIVRDEEGFTE